MPFEGGILRSPGRDGFYTYYYVDKYDLRNVKNLINNLSMIYFKCRTKHPVVQLLSEFPDKTLYDILPSGYGDVVYFKIILGRVTDITGIPKPGELKTVKFDNSIIPLEWLRNIKLKAFIELAEEETQGNVNYLRVLFSYDEKDFNSITLDNWNKDIEPTLLDPIFDFKCYLYSMEI